MMTPDEQNEVDRLYRIRKAVRVREEADAKREAREYQTRSGFAGCGWTLVVVGSLALVGGIMMTIGGAVTGFNVFQGDNAVNFGGAFILIIFMLVVGILYIARSRR